MEGGVVAAPFPHDQNWYRARVVGVADSTLQLLFVDFGDKASVEVAMVKSLRPQYYRLPVQGIPCRLSRIQPTGQTSHYQWKLPFRGKFHCFSGYLEFHCFMCDPMLCNRRQLE